MAIVGARHTPGPWSVERVDYELHGMDASYEVTAGRRVVVQTHMREIKYEGDFLAEDEANCRLIATSPELLQHAQRLLDCLAQCGVTSGVCCCGDDMERHGHPMTCGHTPTDSGAYYTELAADGLRAAIAKATGAS